jgi:hypothetical protein
MPLLNITESRKITATITIERETAENLDLYAGLAGVSADSVIDHALQYVFAKDKDFQAYLADPTKRNYRASIGLRVKKPAAPPKSKDARTADASA